MTTPVRILPTGLAGGLAIFFWGFVALVGLVAGIGVNVPQWNWYRFPTAFTSANLVEHVVGFALVGVVAALIMKPAATEQSHR